MNSRRRMVGGMVLVEALIGASILVVFIFSLTLAQQAFLAQSSTSLEKTQSALLAEEGVEAAKFLRDESWGNVACAASSCGPYGLDWDSTWATTSALEIIDEKFYRSITIERVCRGNSDFFIVETCSGSVTDDPNTKKVTVSVAWSQKNATTTRTMSTYFTNIHEEE